ncbi:MAG: septum formation initiator family protein [Candidatus Omnitrophica bacterium]|nr:septum formation initiator family protein [Candidatus Omnitrophota bacterium]MDD4013739.1 septum formation initiator family protein [Candidatus Omnitrophota bacterium]
MERKKVTLYAVGLFALLSALFLPGYSELQKLRDQREQLKKRIKLLEVHNEGLKEELLKLKADRGYVEKKAREKLGIIEKGEVVYRAENGR